MKRVADDGGSYHADLIKNVLLSGIPKPATQAPLSMKPRTGGSSPTPCVDLGAPRNEGAGYSVTDKTALFSGSATKFYRLC
jgi:hypothetical protein